jgi:hypothetical protein
VAEQKYSQELEMPIDWPHEFPRAYWLDEQENQAVQDVLNNGLLFRYYGLHIYSNIPALVEKAPLSPAGTPWNLPANAKSLYNYAKGACPLSDVLFARTVLLPIPSRLTETQEKAATDAIRQAVSI